MLSPGSQPHPQSGETARVFSPSRTSLSPQHLSLLFFYPARAAATPLRLPPPPPSNTRSALPHGNQTNPTRSRKWREATKRVRRPPLQAPCRCPLQGPCRRRRRLGFAWPRPWAAAREEEEEWGRFGGDGIWGLPVAHAGGGSGGRRTGCSLRYLP